jgi:hypothetical protein
VRLQLQQRRRRELVRVGRAQAQARPGTVVSVEKGFADTTPVSLIDLPIGEGVGEGEPAAAAARA